MPSFRFISSRASLAALITAQLLCVSDAALAGPPIEIRFSAAIVSYKANYQHNQPFDHFLESAGYDVVWRGQIFNTAFNNSGPMILYGGGSAENVFKIGGGTCSGTLRLNKDLAFALAPSILSNKSGVVKMRIPLPHMVANTGLQALIMDGNQGDLSVCRTATAGVASATCFNPTRDCYSIDGTISPGIPVDGDSLKLNRYQLHMENAYFEFSDENPNFSTPFFYSAEIRLWGDTGVETDLIKVIWVGYVTVTTKVGTGTPSPFDPFNFFNYDPTSLGGPPSDPPPPTSNPHNQNDPGFDVREMNSWIKELGKAVNSFISGVQAFFGGSPAQLAATNNIRGGSLGAYDDETGIGTLPASIIKAAPGSGSLQIRLKAVSKNKAKGYRLKVAKKNLKNEIFKGRQGEIRFEVDRSLQNILKKGISSVLFISIKFNPSNGKKGVEKQFRYQIKKRVP